MSTERGRFDATRIVRARRAGRIAVGGGAAVIGYWTLFLAGAMESAEPGSLIHEFELAFPVADALLAAAALGAGFGLLRGARAGSFFLIVAGAMSLYLGVLDITFYARQGFYYPLSGAAGFELFLNLFCTGGGAYALRVGWGLWNGASATGAVGRESACRPPTAPRGRRVTPAGRPPARRRLKVG